MVNNNPPKSQGFSILTIIFAVTAFCLMWAGSIRCNFLKFDSVSGTDESFTMELGMWYYSYWSLLLNNSGLYVFESCNTYPDFTVVDPTWKAAQAFGIITFILGVLVLVVTCVSGCTAASGRDNGFALTHAWESPLYLFTSICQGLVLLLLSSNACNSNVLLGLGGKELRGVTFTETCSISTGAKLVISATVFWFSAAVSSFLAHRAEKGEIAGGLEGSGGEAAKVEVDIDKLEKDVPEQDVPEQAVVSEEA